MWEFPISSLYLKYPKATKAIMLDVPFGMRGKISPHAICKVVRTGILSLIVSDPSWLDNSHLKTNSIVAVNRQTGMPIKFRHERLSFYVSFKARGAAENAHVIILSSDFALRPTSIDNYQHSRTRGSGPMRGCGSPRAPQPGLYRMLHRWHHRLFQAIDGHRRFISAGQRDKEALLVLHLLLKSADVHLAIGDGRRGEFRELAEPIFPVAGILAVP
jgi:hypothetical protein